MESYTKSKLKILIDHVFSLKPENVLIDSDGYCVLSDFGLSEHQDKEVAQKQM